MTKLQSCVLAAALLAAAVPARAQTCSPNVRATAPDDRFSVNADSTVLDKRTGLMWKQCLEGQEGAGCSEGFPLYGYWKAALALADQSQFAGYKDWRLPNIKELQSLLEAQCFEPAVNLAVFPGTPDDVWLWSSSPVMGQPPGTAWSVGFSDGLVMRRYQLDTAARLVRGGL